MSEPLSVPIGGVNGATPAIRTAMIPSACGAAGRGAAACAGAAATTHMAIVASPATSLLSNMSPPGVGCVVWREDPGTPAEVGRLACDAPGHFAPYRRGHTL